MMSANEIFDNVRSDKNIIENEWVRGEMGNTGSSNRKTRTIANNDMRTRFKC
jgi:hypothetical protein